MVGLNYRNSFIIAYTSIALYQYGWPMNTVPPSIKIMNHQTNYKTTLYCITLWKKPDRTVSIKHKKNFSFLKLRNIMAGTTMDLFPIPEIKCI